MSNQNEKSKKTFWPYGILLSILAIVVSCIATIIYSLDYPVHMDNFYFDKYQNVEKNYNEIQISEKEFIKKFDIKLQNSDFKIDKKEKLKFLVLPKQNADITTLKAQILVTRPHTNYENFNLNSSLINSEIVSDEFAFKKLGRWQIMAKISDDKNATKFYNFDINVTK